VAHKRWLGGGGSEEVAGGSEEVAGGWWLRGVGWGVVAQRRWLGVLIVTIN